MKRRMISFAFAVLFSFAFVINASGAADGVYYSCRPCDGELKIALTFDDGPHPRKTLQILDILAEYKIRATFFLIGENVEYYPEAAKRIIAEGHEIGNHTYSHPHNMNKTDKNEIIKEMEECEKSIYKVLGCKPTLFRPPEGVVDESIRMVAMSRGYNVILWSVDTRDWAGASADMIVSGIIKSISPGDIILMHDYTGKHAHTAEALRIMIPKLLEKGYSFVSVSDLINK